MQSLRLSLSMLMRDLRAGELHMLALALLVAVASVASVSFLTERVRFALARDANQLLAADVLLVSDHALAADYAAQATQQGLRQQQSLLFNSMASTEDVAQLVAVKAVEASYPLRGSLRITDAPGGAEREAGRVPAPGEVWLEAQALTALSLKVGDSVQLGRSQFRVGAVLTFESDRGGGFFAFVPRLLMNVADVPATGLIQEGSRVRYRLHVAGEDRRVVARYAAWVQPRLQRGERLQGVDNDESNVGRNLERANRFLNLTALLAVVLAAVACGLSARRYLQRHIDGCAAMRCLGAQRGQLLRLFIGEFVALGLIVGVLGVALGFGVQALLGSLARSLVDTELPAPSVLPAVQGLLVGLVLIVGFVVPQIWRLARVPPVHVLRREWGEADGGALTMWAIGVALLVALMFWMARDFKLGLWVVGGFAGACAVFAGLASLLLALAANVGRSPRLSFGWGARYGLAALMRRRASSVVQVVALALGLVAMLLLTVTSVDLIESWQAEQPVDAPNRFVLNIQPEQHDEVAAFLRDEAGVPDARLLPMVRGRLQAINGQAVRGDQYSVDRARRLVEREFNLSYGSVQQAGNRIVAGQWHGDSNTPQWSVEQGLAETLGIGLGDTLAFEVAGERIEAPVTSLRKVEWGSMRVNFFVVASPAMLEQGPRSFITSFRLPPEKGELANRMVARFPNLTVIDVGAVLAQLRNIGEQLMQVVRYVFGFALAAGAVVMFAAMQATQDERTRELAVLRTLGARNPQLREAMLAEFIVLGVLAGVLAALATLAIGWGLSEFVFGTGHRPRILLLALGAVFSAVVITALGWLGLRGLLKETVVNSLRATS